MNSKMYEDTLKRVNKYKKQLEHSKKGDHEAIKDILLKLSVIPVTYEVLTKTLIGKTVKNTA